MSVLRICTSSPPSEARMEAPRTRSFEAFSAGFLLGHANAAELRIGENTGRDEPVLNGEILPFHQIAVNDLKIVVGNVRECWAALAVAKSPDARNVCLQPTVHFNIAALVGFDACFVETEIVRVWKAAGGDQEMRAGDGR